MPRTFHLLASLFVVIIALLAVGCAPAAAPTTAPPAPAVAPTSPPAAPPTSVPATPTTASASGLPSCATGSLALSTIQTPVPVTPAPTVPPTLAPTLDPSAPTPTARPPTATPRPAPQADHVGFPDGYQTSFKFMGISDRVDNKQVRLICGNDKALSTKPGQPYAYGSVLIFESWRPKEDSSGNVIKDANGRFIREALTTVFVMRKEPGFGTEYQNLRNGEWEYVAYRPDKTVSTLPQQSFSCAACHLGVGPEHDFVLRDDIFTAKDRYIQNPPVDANVVEMWSMAFYPRPYTIKVGTAVKFVNRDTVTHDVQNADKTIDSGPIAPNTEVTIKFEKPGIYDYICAIHPLSMSARIEVKE
ncbi:MAG: cytochrome P460 family protein [Chloroflexota bacterium]